jgi:hypothetical protein
VKYEFADTPFSRPQTVHKVVIFSWRNTVERKDWFVPDSLVSLGIGVIIVVIGFALGFAENYLTIPGVLLSLGLVVLNTLLLLAMLRMLAVPSLSRISANCRLISETNMLKGITVKVEGLITIRELRIVESNALREVWIMCPSLLLDRGYLRTVIIENLKKGVKYRYILPDTREVRARYQELVNEWKNNKIEVSTQVEVLFIKHSEIFTDVGIYDPMTDKAKAVIWTPPLPAFEKYGDKYQKGFLIDDPEPIDYLVSFVAGLWEAKRNGNVA